MRHSSGTPGEDHLQHVNELCGHPLESGCLCKVARWCKTVSRLGLITTSDFPIFITPLENAARSRSLLVPFTNFTTINKTIQSIIDTWENQGLPKFCLQQSTMGPRVDRELVGWLDSPHVFLGTSMMRDRLSLINVQM